MDVPARVLILFCLFSACAQYDSGAIAALYNVMRNELRLPDSKIGTINALEYVFLPIAIPVMTFCFRKFHAKHVLLVGLCGNVLGASLFAFAKEAGEHFFAFALLARAISGSCHAAIAVYGSVWVDSFAPDELTSSWMGAMQGSALPGLVMGYAVGSFSRSWELTLYANVVWFLVILCGMSLIPGRWIGKAHAAPDSDVQGTPLVRLPSVVESSFANSSEGEAPESIPLSLLSSIAVASIFFVSGGLQFWVTPYMDQIYAEHAPSVHDETRHKIVRTVVITITLTAPLLGVVGGGMLTDMLGGYRSSTARRRTLALLFLIAVICLLCGGVACFVRHFWVAVVAFWLFDFAGAALLPGATGVMIAAVKPESRTLASGWLQFMTNLVGMTGGALVPGLITGCTPSESSSHDPGAVECDYALGLQSLLIAPLIGLCALVAGMCIVRQKNDLLRHSMELSNSFHLESFSRLDSQRATITRVPSRSARSQRRAASHTMVVGVIDQTKGKVGVMMLDTEAVVSFQVVLAKAAKSTGTPTRRLFTASGEELLDVPSLSALKSDAGCGDRAILRQGEAGARKLRLDVEIVSTDGSDFRKRWGGDHEAYKFGDLVLRPLYRQVKGQAQARQVKHPPQPFALPTSGNLKDCLPDLWKNCFTLCEKYGPLVKLRIFNDVVYICADPDVVDIVNQIPDKRLPTEVFGIKTIACEGVFIADGQRWEFGRHAMQSSLTGEAIDSLVPIFGRKACKLQEQVLKSCSLDAPVDILEWVEKVTMDVICDVGFGHDMRSLERPIGEKDPLVAVFDEVMDASVNASLYGAVDLFGKQKRWFVRKTADLNGRLDAIIQAVTEGTQTGSKGSLLNKLMGAQCPLTSRKFDQSELRDQLVTMLVAGHKTSSLLLTWALYNIASKPDVQEKLLQELRGVYGDDVESTPSADQLRRCKYLDMVVHETLRLCSPVQVAQRGLSQPVQCGEYTLLPGGHNGQGNSWVAIHIMGISRCEKYWGPNRLEFIPERFEKQNMAHWHPFQYIPFGGGRRLCIGNLFAITQIKTMVTMLLRKYALQAVPERPVKIDPNDLATPLGAHAGGGVWLRIEERRGDGSAPMAALSSGQAPPGFGTLTANAVRTEAGGSFSLAEDVRGQHLLILWGGEFGTTKSAAEGLCEAAEKVGFVVSLKACDQIRATELGDHSLVVILVATYNGHAPANADVFVKDLKAMKDASNWSALRFAVLGMGNSSWVSTFAKIGKEVHAALQEGGAKPVLPLEIADRNDAMDTQLYNWRRALFESLGAVVTHSGLLAVSKVAAPKTYLRLEGNLDSPTSADVYDEAAENGAMWFKSIGYVTCQVMASNEICGKPPASDKHRSVHRIKISLPHGWTYTCGDHLEVLPCNSRDAVQRACKRLGVHPHAAVKTFSSRKKEQQDPRGSLGLEKNIVMQDILMYYVDLQGVPSREALAAMAEPAADAEDESSINFLLDTADSNNYKLWSDRHFSILDALDLWPSVELSPARFFEIAPRMRPRLYSIASSPLVMHDKVELLCGIVGFETDDGVLHHGLCSYGLSRTFTVMCKLKAAPYMRLPENCEVPIVCVCGGTGLAPFLGFLQERAAQQEQGKKVGVVTVFFGCRDDYDCLHESKLRQWEKSGVCRLFVSYSRKPSTPKEYVTTALQRNAGLVQEHLAEGALGQLYLCGSASTLARDCTNVLADILGQGDLSTGLEALNALQERGRVVFDVWG
eukprot:TRINITY_DN19629_c0_g1_i1.p1 TRINITY_DN19629_c0_g1~~TRINITY_DN19629_c0_g1_i1.p1  ORF type:complete len:1733 (-),score=253.55 TRINITY_DN19629_c0_g1_i1:195-5360(-)